MMKSKDKYQDSDHSDHPKENRNSIAFIKGNITLMGREIDKAGYKVEEEYMDSFAIKQLNKEQQEKGTKMHLFPIPSKSFATRKEHNGNHYHITLITKKEIHSLELDWLSSQLVDKSIPKSTTETTATVVKQYCQTFLDDQNLELGSDWYIHGLGRDPSNLCFFLVVSFPRGTALRRKLGLAPKDFHITIAFQDNNLHNCEKNMKSLFHRQQQPCSLINCKLISTPVDLIAASQEYYLGGKPNTLAAKKRKCNYKRAMSLLQMAEIIFEQKRLYGQPIRKELLNDIRDVPNLQIVRDMALIRCQLMGRMGDYENILPLTEFVLEAQNRLTEAMSLSKCLGLNHNGGEHSQILASVLGMRGFVFAKNKCWLDAHKCLEQSYELRSKKIKGGSSAKVENITLVDQKRNEEAIVVERLLTLCCHNLGIQAPLPPLTTFPRTAHLFDSGGTAVTSDDLVISGDSDLFQMMGDGITKVIIEEKIDGANMGFSLSGTGEIIAQNRNHFISSGDHTQFGPLSGWIETHRLSLVKILNSAPDRMQRTASQGLILFGEWMVAKHSIPYHKLPNHFIAFDLYDRLEKKFYSRSRLHRLLVGSDIPCVPVIAVKSFGPYPTHLFTKKEFSSKKPNPFEIDLRNLLETKSRFRSDGGFVEGVVLRIEEKSRNDEQSHWLKHRAKIVRPDFIGGCQEGHWTRKKFEKQTVDFVFAKKYMTTFNGYCLAPPDNKNLEGIGHGNIRLQYKDQEPISGSQPINPRRRVLVSFHECNVLLPRNFSFLWKNEVALSSTPLEAAHILAFEYAFNISLVITLTEENPLPSNWFEETKRCENQFVPVKNYMPPTEKQMDEIMAVIEKDVLAGGAVLVHCGGGKGRAGTVAACLLMKFGHAGIRTSITEDKNNLEIRPKLDSNAAIEYIRKNGPGSIETESQEKCIRNYSHKLLKRTNEVDCKKIKELLPEKSPGNNNIENKPITNILSAARKKKEAKAEKERRAQKARAQRRAPKYVMLMGLPGSGKSTFSASLSRSSLCEPWIIINQDTLGRKACEDLAGSKSKSNRILLDRCNITAAERNRWLEIMHSPPKGDISLVYFSASAETCTYRVNNRENHETIPKGRGGKIVAGMSQKIEPPTMGEKKRFGSIHIVETFEEAESILRLWGA